VQRREAALVQVLRARFCDDLTLPLIDLAVIVQVRALRCEEFHHLCLALRGGHMSADCWPQVSLAQIATGDITEALGMRSDPHYVAGGPVGELLITAAEASLSQLQTFRIAAVALYQRYTLIADNLKDCPMMELDLYRGETASLEERRSVRTREIPIQ
jgi:hypothetical protein